MSKKTSDVKLADIFPFIFNLQNDNNQLDLTPKPIPKGSLIYDEGDECTAIAFVINGGIKVSKIGVNGREVTLYRVSRGETCILTVSSVLSSISYPATAMTEEDTQVILIPVKKFKKLMVTNSDLQHYIYKLLSERLISVLNLVDDIIFRKMDERLVEFLLKKFNEATSVLKITHEEIAIELGTAREVVSRIMKELEREGLIRLSRGEILLVSIEKLKQKLQVV